MKPEIRQMNEITQKSFKELLKIAAWLNIHGHYPIVAGGWACYYYIKGIGSRDIDLILPKNALPVLKQYCESHGFKLNQMPKTRIVFSKTIGNNAIDLDVFSFEHKNRLALNPKIEIAWNLAKDNCTEWRLEKAIMKVPSIELLLLYKTAALIGRKHKIEKWVMPPIQKQHLNAKIEKDTKDLQELLKLNINREKLQQLLQKTKFKKEFENAVKQI